MINKQRTLEICLHAIFPTNKQKYELNFALFYCFVAYNGRIILKWVYSTSTRIDWKVNEFSYSILLKIIKNCWDLWPCKSLPIVHTFIMSRERAHTHCSHTQTFHPYPSSRSVLGINIFIIILLLMTCEHKFCGFYTFECWYFFYLPQE